MVSGIWVIPDPIDSNIFDWNVSRYNYAILLFLERPVFIPSRIKFEFTSQSMVPALESLLSGPMLLLKA